MADIQTLGAPSEFNEDIASSGGSGGGGVAGIRIRRDTAPKIVTADFAPRVNVTIPTGNGKTATVAVVDKNANFQPEPEMLRARWHDIAKRPSGRVCVYDAKGALVARYESWAMAERSFKEADILAAVNKKLKTADDKRAKEEEQAKVQRENQGRK